MGTYLTSTATSRGPIRNTGKNPRKQATVTQLSTKITFLQQFPKTSIYASSTNKSTQRTHITPSQNKTLNEKKNDRKKTSIRHHKSLNSKTGCKKKPDAALNLYFISNIWRDCVFIVKGATVLRTLHCGARRVQTSVPTDVIGATVWAGAFFRWNSQFPPPRARGTLRERHTVRIFGFDSLFYITTAEMLLFK